MEYNDKQVQIMDAAEELFAENGFDGTSVRDIAEQAGVNLAMISYYFGSKEKLMEALFKYRGEFIKMQLENILQNKQMSSMQKMEMLIDNYITRIMSKQCFHKIMSRAQMTNSGGITSKLIYKMKKTNMELFTQLIQEGQKSGEFKKKIDVQMVMVTLVGTVSHLVTSQHYFKELNDLQSLSEEEFQAHIKKKLTSYLKSLFKALLTYE